MARFLILDTKNYRTFIEADNGEAAVEEYRLACYRRGEEYGFLRCFEAPHASPYGGMHFAVEHQ